MTTRSCPNCGQGVEDAGAQWCPNCGVSLAAAGAGPAAGGAGGGAGPRGPSSVPFEDSTQPFLGRFLETIKLAFSDPVRLFSNMDTDDIGAPLIYGVVIGTINVVFSIIWQVMFGGFAALAEGDAEGFAIGTGFLLVILVFSPALVVVGLFINAGIYHVALLILGDGRSGFPTTLRAVSYGSTPGLLGIVPFCGGIIGGIWSLVLVIMAAIYGHRTDTWRAIVAYFLPLLLCCLALFGLMMMLGLTGALAQ